MQEQEGNQERELQLEIAYVLFVDIVGYSKLKTAEQHRQVELLNRIVRHSEHFRKAEANHRIVTVPSGDGMALVFYNTPEAPVECALEISRAVKEHPELDLRMGIHSGPVSGVVDVSGRANVAGAGINMAQRVMDCGDAGHILVSKHFAEDLEHYGHRKRHLHDLGEMEVKHGVRLSVVNLYTEDHGNPDLPQKFRSARKTPSAPLVGEKRRTSWMTAAFGILVAGLIIGGVLWSRNRPATISHAGKSDAASTTGTSAVTVQNKSVAVLPFDNLSRDPDNAFFADGVQDEILTNLAKIADLKVISRTSVAQYKTGASRNLREVGQQLGVAHVVEGSVQRAGNKVRVNAQLIDARTDAHLWAQTYDRDLADVFAIQSEIAKSIADQLQAKLSPKEQAAISKASTTDVAAFELYLRAQALFADTADQLHAKKNFPKVESLLNDAVARDPNFLLAWCLLCRSHGRVYWQGFDHTKARLDLANAAVQTALRLQPDAGEPHLALADYYYHASRDFGRARSELAVARQTLPNNSELFEQAGYIDRREGHWAEATRNLERALELDPRNYLLLAQVGLSYHAQRRYADEIRIYDRALTIVPGDPSTRIIRARVAFDWKGDIKPFQVMLAELIGENPKIAPEVDDPDVALCERDPAAAARALANFPPDGVPVGGAHVSHAYYEGLVAHCQGDSAKAKTAFTMARADLEKAHGNEPDYAPALSLAGIIDAGLGRKEMAIHEGRRACELLPTSKDAIDGPALIVNLALIYTWTGEKQLAIEQLEAAGRIPSNLSYGLLKLHPVWDPLRGDPRFEKLLSSLAPKD